MDVEGNVSQQKTVRDFELINLNYSQYLIMAEEEVNKKKEEWNNLMQNDKNMITNSIQKLRTEVADLQKKCMKFEINITDSFVEPEFKQINSVSPLECLHQSIHRAGIKMAAINNMHSHFEEFLAEKEANKVPRDTVILIFGLVILLIIITVLYESFH